MFVLFQDHHGNFDSDLETEEDLPDWRHTISEEVLKKLSSKAKMDMGFLEKAWQ